MLKKIGLIVSGILFGLPLAAIGFNLSHQHRFLGWWLVLVGAGYFFGGAIYLAITGSAQAVHREAGDRSILFLAPGFLAVYYGAPLEHIFLNSLLPYGQDLESAGVILIILGQFIQLWARLVLAKRYTGHLQVEAGQNLIQHGPYWLIRHPAYSGFLLMALGMAAGFSSLTALLAIPLLLLPGFGYRMKVEEELLTKQYGEEYLAYQKKTKRIIPWVW